MKHWKTIVASGIAALVAGSVWAVQAGPLSFVSGYFLSAPEEPAGVIALIEPRDSLRYFLYTPAGYSEDADRPAPVIVHLHGAMPFPWPVAKHMVRADLAALAHRTERLAAAEGNPAPVIIAPYDGIGFSMWSDSSAGHVQAEADIVTKILPSVVSSMNVAGTREQTFIQGFSMGGFGALKIGLKYPDLFGRVTSWDGAVHDWETLNANRPQIVENMFAREADFEAHSPWRAAETLKLNAVPRIQLFTGTMAAPATYSTNFATHLEALGVSFEHTQTNCPHDVFCFMTDARVAQVYRAE